MRDVEIPETIQRAVWELGAGSVHMPPIIKQERSHLRSKRTKTPTTELAVKHDRPAAELVREIIEANKRRIPSTSKRDFIANVVSIFRSKYGRRDTPDRTLQTAAYTYIKKKDLDLLFKAS